MKDAHTGMGITGAEFDALVGDLVGALDKFKVPEREKGELLGALGPNEDGHRDQEVKGREEACATLDVLLAPAVMPGYGAVRRHNWRGWPRFDQDG